MQTSSNSTKRFMSPPPVVTVPPVGHNVEVMAKVPLDVSANDLPTDMAPGPHSAEASEVVQRMDAPPELTSKNNLLGPIMASVLGVIWLGAGSVTIRDGDDSESSLAVGGSLIALGIVTEFVSAYRALPAISDAIRKYWNNHPAPVQGAQVPPNDEAVVAHMV